MFSEPLKKNYYRIIRYALIVLIITAIILFLMQKAESKAPFEQVASAVTEKLDTTHMEKNSARFLKKYFGLNAEDYEEVLIYTPITNMDAQEMLLIRLKDASQSETVLSAIQTRIDSQLEIYEGYAPEEVALLDAAVVDDRGNYILYIVGNNAEEVDDAFRNSL